MGLFGLLNYEDYILKTVVNSSYARNGLIMLLMYIMTATVRFHLSLIVCFIVQQNNWMDLVSPVIVTVLISMTSNTLFKYVETHRLIHESIVDYFIDNYTRENFIRWKRILMICVLSYILLAVYLVHIDNYFIFLTTIQTAISFCICDLLEHKMHHVMYNKIMNWLYRPQITKFINRGQMIDNYLSKTISESKNPEGETTMKENIQFSDTEQNRLHRRLNINTTNAPENLQCEFSNLDARKQNDSSLIRDPYLVSKRTYTEISREINEIPEKPLTPPRQEIFRFISNSGSKIVTIPLYSSDPLFVETNVHVNKLKEDPPDENKII
jgi:hypothetical protein